MPIILLITPGELTVPLEVNESINVLALKHIIQNALYVPNEYQQLYHNDILLEDDYILDDLDDNIFRLLYEIKGGGCRYKKAKSCFRWKWKKKRIRRLQRKRRKMRIRSR
tara:strand:- start:470 stop:799 length:330 start_codon:yes stop_codon:yes gene_type:complete